jgi:hypothetical protein
VIDTTRDMQSQEFDDTPKLVTETRQGGGRGGGAPSSRRPGGPVAESIAEGVEEPGSPRGAGKAGSQALGAEVAGEVDWSPKAGAREEAGAAGSSDGDEPVSPRSLRLTPPKPIATSQAQGG